MIPEHSRVYDRLPGYPLAGIPEIRRRLQAEGVDLIDLGAGDADLDPPPAAVELICQTAWPSITSRTCTASLRSSSTVPWLAIGAYRSIGIACRLTSVTLLN